MSWGSLFQTEAAMATKARSPVEEHRVAGMTSEDDLLSINATCSPRGLFTQAANVLTWLSSVFMFSNALR